MGRYKIKQINNFIYASISYNIGNVYLLILNDSNVALVDTGSPGTMDRIIELLGYVGCGISNVTSIFVTHADGDHIGNLGGLLEINKNIIVYASTKTWEYITQQRMPKHFPVVIEFLIGIKSNKSLAINIENKNTVHLKNKEILDFFGGLKIIKSPGHTDDHISFYLEKYKILFSGDVIVNIGLINKPPKFINSNDFLLKKSYNRLMSLNANIICCGHGDVYIGLEEIHKKL